ncbi:MAG: serine/threonine-protein kinase [Rubrivivax sp.]
MSSDLPGQEKTMLVPRRDVDADRAPGPRIGPYIGASRLGVGGHGIVYRARDAALGRKVAVKEYMPATLAQRAPWGGVRPRSERHEAAFAAGLKSFLNEAKLLAFFDHPALVKVHQFWAENGTAYMAMTLYEGMTLKAWLAQLGAPPSEAWLRQMAGELIEVLGLMHERQCYHRDIAPDNILMRFDKSSGSGSFLEQRPHPLLLDFGSARRVIGQETQTLTAVLKPGYSPPEQYDGETSQRQGPWTDVYALAAVLYTAVFGKPPPSSVARLIKDEMVPAAVAGAGRYSPSFLSALDAGLEVRPETRLRSMAEFKQRLGSGEGFVPESAAATAGGLSGFGAAAGGASMRPMPAVQPPPPSRGQRLLEVVLIAVLVLALLAAAWFWFAR